MTGFKPPGLPWHFMVGEHVYVYAGGETLWRATKGRYAMHVDGHVIEPEWLRGQFNDHGEFEAACTAYEQRHPLYRAMLLRR